MRYLLPVSIFLYSLIATGETLRILVGFPMSSRSHSILGHGVVDRLLEAGHEVVHITSFPKENPVPNLKEIDVSAIGNAFHNDPDTTELMTIKNIVGKGNVADSLFMFYFAYIMHKSFIEEPNVVKLLSDPKEKFDAVILEWFFSELNAGIPQLYGAPLIWLASTEPHWQALRIMDEIPNPAYNVDILATHGPPLNFCERFEQLWRIVLKATILTLFQEPLENWVYNNIYGEIATKRGVNIAPYYQAMYNASLMFVNSHPSIGGAMKLPQNAINIAGYHISEKTKPLPTNLQKLMDEAKHGVIYFSLGSNMQSDGMSDLMKQSLLNMFSKFEQVVIWKFESNMSHSIPNVHLVKWAPQTSILAHPNLKLFITHGGQLSTTEAIHFGVPLVGIPLMADQYINMESVERKGYGIQVTLAEDMADTLEAAIRKVLTDELFKAKKEMSAIFHNRPMKPGAALAFWVDLVVRTHGAPHLRSPALTVTWYQRFYLDLLVVMIIVIYIVRKVFKCVMGMRSKASSKKSKNE